jgi:tetratricopeptide (TPR) repeat protein
MAPAQSNTVTAPAELITALGVTQPANLQFQAGAFALFGQGLKILAWPYPLRLHYGEPGDAAFAIYIAIQILLGGWAIYLLAKGRPILAFSLVFYYLALLPSVHLLGFGDPHMSERYLYFPSVGMTLALAFGFRSVATRLGRKNLSMIMLPILLALAAISWGRNADWNSESQLFETEYQFGDRGSRTLRNLAAAHFDNGRFQRVVEICDENPSTVIKYIKFTLGCANSYSRVARTDDAIDVLDRFVRSDESEGSRITARLTMASIYLARKQYQQVAGQYMVIIEQVKKPSHKEMYKGELLLLLYPDNKEQLEIARRLFQQAIEKDPGLIAAQKRIKQVNERLAKIDSASHSSDSN